MDRVRVEWTEGERQKNSEAVLFIEATHRRDDVELYTKSKTYNWRLNFKPQKCHTLVPNRVTKYSLMILLSIEVNDYKPIDKRPTT